MVLQKKDVVDYVDAVRNLDKSLEEQRQIGLDVINRRILGSTYFRNNEGDYLKITGISQYGTIEIAYCEVDGKLTGIKSHSTTYEYFKNKCNPMKLVEVKTNKLVDMEE